MPLYSYICPGGHHTELVRPLGHEGVGCPVCGQMAARSHVYHTHVVGPTVDTRGMYRRFSEATQEWDHAVSRQETSVGHEIKTGNLWAEGKARAQAMAKAGESFRPLEGT